MNMTIVEKRDPPQPCMKCGSFERYASRSCKPCAIARSAAWRKSNPERNRQMKASHRATHKERLNAEARAFNAANPGNKKAASAAWYAANKERHLAVSAAWVAANPEKVRAIKSAWKKANPEAVRIDDHNRRARKKAGGKLSKGLTEKLFVLQKGKCACCRKPLGDDYHLDHIMPLSRGGSNTDDNMQLLRAGCNLKKSAKHPVDFMQQRGFLL